MLYIIFKHCGNFFVSSILIYSATPRNDDGDQINGFDYLTFAQSWPPSVCIIWMTMNDENACNLPKQPDSWVIHGIWPSKRAAFGPEFCENNLPLQINKMPIVDRLRQAWPNIYKGNSTYQCRING